MGRRLSVIILLIFLAFDGFVFWATAAHDLVNYPREQWASAVIRFIVGILNLVAAWKVLPYAKRRQPARQRPNPRRAQQRVPPNDPWVFPAVVAAQISAIPMILVPIWIEIMSPINDGWDIGIFVTAWAMFFFATIVIVVAFARHVSMPGTWVALAALLPALGAVQFWYLNFYKPSHDRPSVDVTTSLREISHTRDSTRLQGSITLKNVGGNSVNVLGSLYTAAGVKMASAQSMTSEQASRFLDLDKPDRRHFGKHASLVRFDDVIRAGEILSPGQKWSTSFLLDASTKNQHMVRLTVSLSLLTHIEHAQTSECENKEFKITNYRGAYRCTQMDLPTNSWVRDILGDHPLARTVTFFPSDKSPYIETRYQSADRNFKESAKSYKEQQEDAQVINSLVRSQGIETFTENRVDP